MVGNPLVAVGEGVVSGAKSVAGAAQSAGKAVADAAQGVGKVQITQEQIQELLGACYDKALNGVPGVSRSLEDYVGDYTTRFSDPEIAARELIKNQLVKCTTSGALSGAAGFFALPVTLAAIPANIANVLYVQLRMIAGVAMIGGLDVRTDQVQTLVYACLAGKSATDLLKEAGINVGQKMAMSAIKKIPGAALTSINQKVGFRLITKFGQTGVVNLGKLVPVVGAVVGGAFDFGTTKVIADTAYKYFIDVEVDDLVEMEGLEFVEAGALDAGCEPNSDNEEASQLTPHAEASLMMSLDEQIEAVTKLKSLVDAGILTEEEFELKKKQVMGL